MYIISAGMDFFLLDGNNPLSYIKSAAAQSHRLTSPRGHVADQPNVHRKMVWWGCQMAGLWGLTSSS